MTYLTCHKLVTTLILNELHPFLIAGGVVVVVKILKNGLKKGCNPFFSQFLEIFTELLFFCYNILQKTDNYLNNRTANHVTKCNKIQKSADFVTFCYKLLHSIFPSPSILLHFVTPYNFQYQLNKGCNKCNKIYLLRISQNNFSPQLTPFRDANKVNLNPSTGEMLRAGNRLFEITGFWYKGLQRESVDLVEYQFPDAWWEIIREEPAKLELMKKAYPKRDITIKLSDLQQLVSQGKMCWFWIER